MNKDTAKRLVQETLQNSFDKERFTFFVKNLLNHIKETPQTIYRGNFIPDAYKPYIKTLDRIGKYEDTEKHKIDILVVHLKKQTSLERARTMQRNFVAWYLNGSRGGVLKDAALVAFVSPDKDDWRFSFVKMEYKLAETLKGNIKTKEQLTPARRYSFLVGKNETSHTAQSQFVPILIEDDHNPTLKQVEDAFGIEKVTKEFFEKYRELFLKLKEALEEIVKKNKKIKVDFEAKNVDGVDFAKKLLGQIVFLYFLQKKGWFGVARDAAWGTGPKNFLRQLFDKETTKGKNFFNDSLELLFYEALAVERTDDFYGKFNCKIPFLNGGLFDPINNYDWVHTDILLPNELFSNTEKTKQGDTGTGILDVFDRYNFTVKEDEPLEKEVAVDPEMLGKVFENLLEVKDRKSKGTYYTPREIVHYMCQQSLINYLDTTVNTGEKKTIVPEKPKQNKFFGEPEHQQTSLRSGEPIVPREDITSLILHGQSALEHDTRVEIKGRETKRYPFQMPETIRKNAAVIDKTLESIRICDPAAGSGAFLVGMMHEIVNARQVLSTYLNGSKNRTPYDFKRNAIQNCLYGVDIDPGAVEIAKLRLWLSLIVDEEDIKQIKPLPNLDFKIMQGNSLLEDFHGISLTVKSKVKDSRLFDETGPLDKLISDLSEKQNQFFDATQARTKEKLRIEVKQAIINIFHFELERQKADYFRELRKIKDKSLQFPKLKDQEEYYQSEKAKLDTRNNFDFESVEEELRELTHGNKRRNFFPWKLYFANIFHEKGGFDIVIANPPYLKERDNKERFAEVNESEYGKKYHQGKMDFWYYFLHKAIDIVKANGTISYITSRYWLNSAGAKKLIKRVKQDLSFVNVVDIGKLKVFDNVAGQHMVAVYAKDKINDDFVYKKLINGLTDINEHQDTGNLVVRTLKNSKIFSDSDEIIIESNSIELSKTIKIGTICDISQGVVEATDKLGRKQVEESKRTDVTVGQGVFVLTKRELSQLCIGKEEKETIKKYLDPNDVFRYGINLHDNKYLIYSDKGTKHHMATDRVFVHLKKHLDNLREFITSSNAPYGLHRPREAKFFEESKIIFKNMFVENQFVYDEDQFFVGFSFSLIIQRDKNYDLKYILAILNSKFALDWFYRYGKKRGAGLDIGVEKLRSFPIRELSPNAQKPFVSIVEKILAITKSEDYQNNESSQSKVKELEKQIDQMVYELYGLTDEEIAVIENSGKK